MKTLSALLIILFSVTSTFGQNITGQWTGLIKFGVDDLAVVFDISESRDGLVSNIASPEQIPVTKTTFENSSLRLLIASHMEYNGVLKDNILTGMFKQSGVEYPLVLSKAEHQTIKRPQEPKHPLSYRLEEVTFSKSKADITLAGTLTLPAKRGIYPAVILISGRGPQNRDEELFGHKPFLVLADHLTKNGIAVLRFDDRGVAKSGGNFQTATIPDFISDVESAIGYLKTRKEINKERIGLVGYSEGGIIGQEIAAQSADVKFLVLLAAPGIEGYKLLLLQKEKVEKQMGIDNTIVLESQELYKGAYEIILKSPVNNPTLSTQVSTYFKDKIGNQVSEDHINTIVKQLSNPWKVSLVKYDPVTVLKGVKIPVLALNGGKDLQVSASENLTGIKNTLAEGGNRDVTTKEYPNLNHLFQQCKSCLPAEYAEIEETFSNTVLDDMTAWIIAQVNKK